VVHDYLNQRGGAERVALEFAELWPQAPIYTALYRPDSTFPEFAERDVRTSWVDKVPVDRKFRALFPLFPAAFRSLGVLDQELVVTSSSGWAHGVRTAPGTLHVVYCHTPARWLYRRGDYLGVSSRQQRAAGPLMNAMERWDKKAARRATTYVANSVNTQRRIEDVYGIHAEVVYPPVSTERFRPLPRGERLLVVSRLIDYKRVDAVIRAANKGGLPLDVVGVGPSLEDLRAMAGPTVTLHGRLPDEDINELMENCRAVVLPGEEDFGIVPVEAQAAGKPVVALAAGGALETVVDGYTGTFFRDHAEERVLDAIRRADTLETSPEEIAQYAQRFSRAEFRRRMHEVIAEAQLATNGKAIDVPVSR
jgi:glycosyltransferase involved in cell wall biosynthesis